MYSLTRVDSKAEPEQRKVGDIDTTRAPRNKRNLPCPSVISLLVHASLFRPTQHPDTCKCNVPFPVQSAMLKGTVPANLCLECQLPVQTQTIVNFDYVSQCRNTNKSKLTEPPPCRAPPAKLRMPKTRKSTTKMVACAEGMWGSVLRDRRSCSRLDR